MVIKLSYTIPIISVIILLCAIESGVSLSCYSCSDETKDRNSSMCLLGHDWPNVREFNKTIVTCDESKKRIKHACLTHVIKVATCREEENPPTWVVLRKCKKAREELDCEDVKDDNKRKYNNIGYVEMIHCYDCKTNLCNSVVSLTLHNIIAMVFISVIFVLLFIIK